MPVSMGAFGGRDMRLSVSKASLILSVAILTISGCNTPNTGTKGDVTDYAKTAAESKRLAVVTSAYSSFVITNPLQIDINELILVAKNGHGVAYIEPIEGKFRVVHNGRADRSYPEITHLAVSPDGKRAAYVAQLKEGSKRIVADGWEGPLFNDIRYPMFSPDGRHLVYRVFRGETSHIVVDNKERFEYMLIQKSPVISSDSRLLAFTAKSPDGGPSQFVISDMTFQDKTVFDGCGEFFVESDDSSRFAVLCSEGENSSIKIIDFLQRKEISSTRVRGKITRIKFAANNQSFAYSLIRGEQQRYIVHNGREEMVPAGDEIFSDPLVFSDSAGVGAIIGTAFKARLYRAFQKNKRNEPEYGYISDFIASKDGRHNAYLSVPVNKADEVYKEQWQIVVDGYPGPFFDKIVAPLFSPDGSFIVYRARQSGKRFIVVSDLKGNVISQHRGYDLVFPPVFLNDGKSLGYGVLDGNELWWKVEKISLN